MSTPSSVPAASSEQRTREIEALTDRERAYLVAMPSAAPDGKSGWIDGVAIADRFDAAVALLRAREQEAAEAREVIRAYVVAIGRAPNNRAENEVDQASTRLVAVLASPLSKRDGRTPAGGLKRDTADPVPSRFESAEPKHSWDDELRDELRHAAAERDAAVRDAAELREALREILRHTGANEFGDCQARREDEPHPNCRPVIFEIARAALGAA